MKHAGLKSQPYRREHAVTKPFNESHPFTTTLIGVDSEELHRPGEQTVEAATRQTLSLVGVIQLASGACFIFLIAIGIMIHPLFLCGVVVFAMMTTSTSTLIMFASASSTRQERNAIAVIASAIPKLTTLSGMNRLYAHMA